MTSDLKRNFCSIMASAFGRRGKEAVARLIRCLLAVNVVGFLFVVLPLAAASAAEIFRCTSPNGQPVFQQNPCDPSQSSATSGTPTGIPTSHSTNAGTFQSKAANRCEQVADAVRQIGDGYRVGESESTLRKRLTSRFDSATLNKGFAAFAVAGSVSTEDLALFSQLICESLTPLPPPQPWHLNQNGIAIRLQGWEQTWRWPSSWRLVGVREQPGFQLELAYADFDAAHLRVGCRGHLSHQRLEGKGHQLLALWAEHIQPGASQQPPQHAGTLNKFGDRVGRDPVSKRELYRAQLPRTDVAMQTRRDGVPEVSVALAPERLCIMIRKGNQADDNMERQARTLVELLLTNQPSPFAGGK